MTNNIEFKNAYDQSGYAALMERFGPVVGEALSDNGIYEIMLNSDGSLFVDGNFAHMEQVGVLSRDEAESVIRTLATLMDKDLNLKCPILSGEIPYNGSRFEGLLPPLVSAPVFSIRRHNHIVLPLQLLVENHVLSSEAASILNHAINDKRSIIVSGATGSGKTTLVNSLINEINPYERLITIEDTPELQLSHKNHLNLYTSDTVDMSTLLRSALRLRPDRIIVGEVRGAEALDMIDAFSTGHRGGLATIHAGSIQQALQRLTLLISRHPAAPRLIEPTLASAIDFIVQIERKQERHVTSIAQIQGYSDGHFQLKYLYHYQEYSQPCLRLGQASTGQTSGQALYPSFTPSEDSEKKLKPQPLDLDA